MRIYAAGINEEILLNAEKPRQLQYKTFKPEKNDNIFQNIDQKGFNGNIVNRALPSLHEGPLEIILIVP